MIARNSGGSFGKAETPKFPHRAFDPMPSISGVVYPGRRLRALDKVVCYLLRNGKLGLKLTIKILFFFIDIEISFESNWWVRG
jgi:hypothetical protein